MDGIHYCIDGTGRAIDFKTCKVYSETAIMKNFNNYCASDNVKEAFCQIDRDSEEQVKEGMTTYGVRTKDSHLMTIAIHENNYALCKDQMAILGSSVQKANEKIKQRKNDIGRKVVLGGTIAFVLGTVTLAGKIKLEQSGIIKNDTSIVITTEENTMTDATEITTEATTETPSIENMSSEQIQQSIDNFNEQKSKEQVEYVEQLREPYQSVVAENVVENNQENVQQSTPVEQMSADQLRQSIDDYNNQVNQQQIQELQQLRQDYQQQMTQNQMPQENMVKMK